MGEESAHKLEGCTMVLESSVFQNWRQTGLERGLNSDSKIASFLLSRYEESRMPNAETLHLCNTCQTPLTLVCLTCDPAQTRYEENTLLEAKVCSEDGTKSLHHRKSDSYSKTLSLAIPSDVKYSLLDFVLTDNHQSQEKDVVSSAAALLGRARDNCKTSRKEFGKNLSQSQTTDEKVLECFVKVADIASEHSGQMLKKKELLKVNKRSEKKKILRSKNYRDAIHCCNSEVEKNEVNASNIKEQTESQPEDFESIKKGLRDPQWQESDRPVEERLKQTPLQPHDNVPTEERVTVKKKRVCHRKELLPESTTGIVEIEEEKTLRGLVCLDVSEQHSGCHTHENHHAEDGRISVEGMKLHAEENKLSEKEMNVEDRTLCVGNWKLSADSRKLGAGERKLNVKLTDSKIIWEHSIKDRTQTAEEKKPKAIDRKVNRKRRSRNKSNAEDRIQDVGDKKLNRKHSVVKGIFSRENGKFSLEDRKHEEGRKPVADDWKPVADDWKPYRCEHCPASFRSRGNLVAHSRKHTGERPFCCDICGKSFARSTTLKQHERVHSDDRPYKCEVCGEAFRQRGMLIVHRRKAHTLERPFSCSMCSASFVVKGHLQVHMLSHTNHRPFLCEECGASFKHKGILETHKMIHTGVRPFSCDICHKTFYRQTDVRTHKKSHLNMRNMLCTVCGSGFGSKGRLQRHMQRHSGVRPFQCSECGKDFASSSERKVHMRVHSGDRPYVCDMCGRRFQTMGNMKKHRHTRHKNAPPYHVPSALRTDVYTQVFQNVPSIVPTQPKV